MVRPAFVQGLHPKPTKGDTAATGRRGQRVVQSCKTVYTQQGRRTEEWLGVVLMCSCQAIQETNGVELGRGVYVRSSGYLPRRNLSERMLARLLVSGFVE